MTDLEHRSVHFAIQKLNENAKRLGDSYAIEWADGTMTYSSLRAAVYESARQLHETGVRPSAVIAIRAERSRQLLIQLLAAWSVEAIPALIDNTLPEAYVRRCEQSIGAGWRLTGATSMVIESLGDGSPVSGFDGASHILFTSGTTAAPSAVVASRSSLEEAMNWYGEYFSPTADDRVGLMSGLGHDPILRDLLVPLLSGGTLVIPDTNILAAPRRAADFVSDQRISILHCTPALLELCALSTRAPQSWNSVRLILCGGAPLAVTLATVVLERTRGRLFNVYGATETPQIVSCFEVRRDDSLNANFSTVPIGTGVGNATVGLVPVSADTEDLTGDEIVVTSSHLAMGFVSVDDDSSVRLKALSESPAKGTYHTGDLGSLRGDGQLRVVGRIESSFSINGQRISRQMVEESALAYPGVHLARARVEELGGRSRLSLAVAIDPNVSFGITGLREYLERLLPPFGVPRQIEIVERNQLDPNLKIATNSRRA